MGQFEEGHRVAIAVTPETRYAAIHNGWRPAPYFVLWATITSITRISGKPHYGFLPNAAWCANGTLYQPASEQVFQTETGAKNYLRETMEKALPIKQGSVDIDAIPVHTTDAELYSKQIPA